jgi:hypothetical protein
MTHWQPETFVTTGPEIEAPPAAAVFSQSELQSNSDCTKGPSISSTSPLGVSTIEV